MLGVAFLAVLPPFVVSLLFLKLDMDLWLAESAYKSIKAAFEMAKEEYQRKENALKRVAFIIEKKRNISYRQLSSLPEVKSGVVAVGIPPFLLGKKIQEGRILRFEHKGAEYLVFSKYGKTVWVKYNKLFVERANSITRQYYRYRNLWKKRNLIKMISGFVFVIFLVPFFVLTFVVSGVISRRLSRPIHQLIERTRRISVGDFTEVNYRGDEEFIELFNSFNSMARALKRGQEAVAEARALSKWKGVARKMAHEVKNPLTPIKLTLQYLLDLHKKRDPSFEEEFSERAKEILIELDSIQKIVNDFAKTAGEFKIEKASFDLAEVLRAIVNIYSVEPVKLEYQGPDSFVVKGSQELLTRVFSNIVKNAVDVVCGREAARVVVGLKPSDGKVLVWVKDNGPGIPPEIREKVFEDGFTTKQNGSGVGLSLAKFVVEAHGGRIWFDSSSEGTTFYIELPVE